MGRTGGAERRAQFIATAQQLFFTKGYENTSINDIIKAVGVSKGAFYHHFGSKTAVLEAIVTQIAEQAVANMQAIITDETLSAIPKWQKAVQLNNSWKIERKAEMLETSRLMHMDENILLAHKIRTETLKGMAHEMAKIISQGVNEGIFDVEHILETAEIMMVNISTLSETMNELIFNYEKYDDPAAVALQKNAAVQTAVERLLGAPSGSMPIIDKDTLIAWFAN
ncbi:MAG: TetR/AcrR family transcriptional regulator [Chloroflexi bacterium]|nr:TetR/AcrR family transcriptional regulator [Chloroflexota bacterium]